MTDLASWLTLAESHEDIARGTGDLELAGRLQLARELVTVLLDARAAGVMLVPRKDRPSWWAGCKDLKRKGKRRAKSHAGCISR